MRISRNYEITVLLVIITSLSDSFVQPVFRSPLRAINSNRLSNFFQKRNSGSLKVNLDESLVPNIGYSFRNVGISRMITNLAFPLLVNSRVPQVLFHITKEHISTSLNILKKIISVNEYTELNISNWHLCALSRKCNLNDRYTRYRFELLNSKSNFINQKLGQEMILYIRSTQGNLAPTKVAVFPVISKRGTFDIVFPTSQQTTKGGDLYKPHANSNSHYNQLNNIEVGDEIAFKGGHVHVKPFRRIFSNTLSTLSAKLPAVNTIVPIQSISLVMSGLGVTIALPMLQAIADNDPLSLSPLLGNYGRASYGISTDTDKQSPSPRVQANTLWINESPEDFILDSEIINMHKKGNENMNLNSMLLDGIDNISSDSKRKIHSQFGPYKEGQVAVICGPYSVVSKFRYIFDELGYPGNSVAYVTTS